MASSKLIDIKLLNLSVNDLELTYNLSLCLKKGERIGITGPSGCGKSTLVKSILSESAGSNSTYEKFKIDPKIKFSYIPQSSGLLPWFSLRKNFELFNCGFKYEDLISEFKLGAVLNSFPSQLSGGEYQRATVALSIVNKPDVVIADEPLTELDIANKWRILHYWSTLIHKYTSSLLLVSHDLETLIYLCDRILILSDKPSTIIKEIDVRTKQVRSIDFILSDEFLRTKKAILESTNGKTDHII